jgi:hypothetical protein
MDSPWIIGIGAAVIGGVITELIRHYCFGIGKPTEPKYSVDELKELFEKLGPVNSHIEIKGDNNKVSLIEK